MTAASEKTLAALHSKVADAYDKALEKAIQDGDIPATLLTSATNFLKTNGISCDLAEDPEETARSAQKQMKKAAGNVLEFPFDPEEPTDV